MKVEYIKELNSITSDIIEEATENPKEVVKVGRKSTMVKYLMKKFIKRNKLVESDIEEAWFLLEKECRNASVWKENRDKSALKDEVQFEVRKFISSLEMVKGNVLTLEDGTKKIVDVIFKKD